MVGCFDGTLPDPSGTVSVSVDRLQTLEACEARADLQQQHIELLQKQIAETDAALKLELARGEKHAEALMHIARTCDERTSDMKEQHATALRVKDMATAKSETLHAASISKLEAQHNAAISKSDAQHKDDISKLEAQHKDAITKLEAENAALKAQAASTLKDLAAAITTGTMEILPIRPDRRQFAEWRTGGIPQVELSGGRQPQPQYVPSWYGQQQQQQLRPQPRRQQPGPLLEVLQRLGHD
jgi:hypothetical protein